jgi:hypothetical protein
MRRTIPFLKMLYKSLICMNATRIAFRPPLLRAVLVGGRYNARPGAE